MLYIRDKSICICNRVISLLVSHSLSLWQDIFHADKKDQADDLLHCYMHVWHGVIPVRHLPQDLNPSTTPYSSRSSLRGLIGSGGQQWTNYWNDVVMF